MPLTLVLGPANSAKAGEVLGAYSAAARRDALLVVPTQADAAHYDRELAGSGVALGRTLTFDGLLGEIALRAGYDRPRLGPLARELTVARAVAETPLHALSASAATPGFSAAVGALISRLAGQRVSAQRFSRAVGAAGQNAQSAELAAIYRAYAGALAQTGSDDAETHAYGALDALRARPEAWRDTPVFLYGFDDLTAIEQDAVETLAGRIGAAVTVSLTYEPGRAALAARASVVAALAPQASAIRELPAQDTFYAAPQLHHLERHLFEPGVEPIDPGGAVRILEAGGERAEAELVAAEVLSALREGVPAEEIVVVTRSLRRSGALLEAALERYGVPATSARRIPFTHTALGRGVAATLSGEALTYLRLTREPEVVDALEADARRHGAEVSAQLPDLEGALAELMPRSAGRPLSAGEQLDVRAAGVLRAALAEVANLSTTEVRQLLDGLEVPAGGAGAVLVAEPLAIRARRFRRVVVTGLCEGEFPAPEPPDPLLGEERRRELALDAGLTLAPTPDAAAAERYLLYACVSRASERISFSYRCCDEDGNQVGASPFLDDVLALFREVPRRRRLLADVIWEPAEAPTRREFELAVAGVTVSSPQPADLAATRTLSAAALGHVRHAERVSPSALEKFAACPVAWLVERQLEPGELAPEGDALVKGTILHDVLRRLRDGEPDLLDRLEVPPELASGRPPEVRAALMAGIVAELRRYRAWEAANPQPGFVTQAVEWPFRVTLQGGVEVTGTIDRLDVDAGGRAIVWDYKSGTNRDDRAARRWLADRQIQVALYMLAVRGDEQGLDPVAGIYQPLSGADLRPRGAALAEAGLPLRGTDVLDPAELETLLGEVEAEVDRLAGQLARGELTPCPETCSPDGCRHPGICWAGR